MTAAERPPPLPDVETLRRELADLRSQNEGLSSRNRELEETLDALQSGELDAIVVRKGERRQVYTLEGADHPYRVLVENIQEGALTLTVEGMVLYANPAFAAMRRQPPGELIGTRLRDQIAPRDRGLFDDLLRRSRDGPGRAVMRICSGAGAFPVVISMTPIVVDESPRLSVVVSNRKEDYDRLLLQSRMLDAVADAVIATDPAGRIIYWSESAARIYGWTEAEAMGRRFDDLVARDLSPDEARRRDDQFARGEAWSGEYVAVHRDGHRFPVQGTKAPVFDEDGRLVAIIGASHDITDRKRAEEEIRLHAEELETLMETVPVAIFVSHDPECHVITGNRMANMLYEEQEGGNFSGTPAPGEPLPPRRFFVEGREIPGDELPMQVAAARGVEVRNAEIETLLPSGKTRVVLGSAAPLRSADGSVRGSLGAFVDITGRREMERALAESERRQAFLLRLGDALRPLADPVDLQGAAVRVLGEHLGADRVNYFEVEGDDYVVERDYAPAVPHAIGRHPIAAFGPRLLAEYRAGRTVVAPDIGADPDLSPAERAACAAIGVRAFIGVPLVKGGELVAGLGVNANAPRAWTPGEVALVEETAERTWAAVERARAAEALLESEERYRSLVENSIDAVLLTSPDGAILGANAEACRIFGMTEEELMQAGRDAVVDLSDLRLGPALEERQRTGRFQGELRYRRKDGTVFPGEVSTALFTDRDGAVKTTMILRDVTERETAERELARYAEDLRESRQQLADVIEATGAGYYLLALDGSSGTVSRRGTEILGFPAGQAPTVSDLGPWLRARVHPDDLDALLDSLAAFIAGETERTEAEFRVLNRDGRYRWVQAISTPVRRDETGRVVTLAGFLFDIDKRKRAEEALERSNEELQRFAYVASHDLQEPLRSIVSFSQLLERRYRGRLDQDADEYIAFIVEGGNRMQTLIQDLLQVSRVETGAKPLAPTDAGAVVAGALRLLEAPIREASGKVAVGPMPCVLADATQLEQVFTNLIGNAVKYRRPEVPLEVRVSAERRNGWWEFAVADNGIGIEAEYYDRIFEMFRRLHTHDQYEGTGIGLAVVKRIVERHGGAVRVESTPGEGSTFFFTLPAA